MKHTFSISALISTLLIFVSCSGQQTIKTLSESAPKAPEQATSDKSEPHRYGGWYCPDNFNFTPVDIQKLDEVPAISDRLPSEEELRDNKSLINVDIEKYPDARALEMKLPRVGRVYVDHKRMSELAIVIQAIVVQGDTVAGYRFVNGGNGSCWLSDVTFLSDEEVAAMGSQPFFFSKSEVKANTADIWKTLTQTEYFKQLGEKFGEQAFFSSAWDAEAGTRLSLDTPGEKASGYIGMVFGNYYMHIDYIRDGFHYSEKMLIMENKEKNTTELFIASGPFPENFEQQQATWNSVVEAVEKGSKEN